MIKKDIVIVGGGTAGWFAARLFLSAQDDANFFNSITLIESEDIPPIGVGEGSWPEITKIYNMFNVGVDKLNATKKLGINYKNWYSESPSKYNNWYHPFAYSNFKDFTNAFDMDNWTSVNYAYHFDVFKLQKELKEICLGKKFNYIRNEVTDVKLDNTKNITSVILKDGSKVKGDFFIDCTGFRRELISKLNSEIIDYSDKLICDSALVTHLNEKNNKDEYFTDATALSSGWSWRIPLKSKTGVGYVYSSKFITDEKAKEEFNSFLGSNNDYRIIKFNSHRLKNSMINNCVAVGLSSGFFEPLEATSIGFMLRTLKKLMQYFTDKVGDEKEKIDFFNKQINNMWEYGFEYIFAHYMLSNRNNSDFWKYVRKLQPSKLLDEFLSKTNMKELYRDDNSHIDNTIFVSQSWAFLMVGMNWRKGL